MPLTIRELAPWACACVGVALLVVVGCATGPGKPADLGSTKTTTAAATTKTTKPATTRAASAPSKPVNETVLIELDAELGPFAPRARGVMRPKATPAPGAKAPAELPRDLLAALGKLAEGRESAEPPTLVTIGDLVKWDGAYPGEKRNWSKWDQGVAELIAKQKAEGRPVIYEVFKEPDDKKVFKDRVEFFAAWVRTVKTAKRVWPEAVVMGPGIAKNDGGWVQEFLKIGKEFDALPDVVSWHEENLKQDIAGHVGGVADGFWQDGSNRSQIAISPSAAIEAKFTASDPLFFMAQMERSARANAPRPITHEFLFKLTHLFTAEGKPRSLYYTYREYAALENAGRSMKVSWEPTVEGVAVWSGPQRTARVLLGRNRARVEARHVTGDVTMRLKGVSGATVLVRTRRIADTGAKESQGPEAAVEAEHPVKNGEALVPLPGFVSGDALAIEVNVRGSPPATKPSTVPATTKASTRPAPK